VAKNSQIMPYKYIYLFIFLLNISIWCARISGVTRALKKDLNFRENNIFGKSSQSGHAPLITGSKSMPNIGSASGKLSRNCKKQKNWKRNQKTIL